MELGYLAVLIVYSAVVLVIGVWGFRRESRAEYVVYAGRMGLPMAVGTFVGTFVSAASLIAFIGFMTRFGTAIIATYYWGIFCGFIALTLFARKMRRAGISTVPQVFEVRFESPNLRAMIAVFVIVSLAFSIMTQLVAVSLVLQTIIGLPQWVGIVVVGGVFVVYTILGGMIAVVRTDFLQTVLLLSATFIAAIAILFTLGGNAFVLEPKYATFFAGPIKTPPDILLFSLTVFGGVSAQSYYLQRLLACKDVPTARQMIGVGSLLILLFYLALLVIGWGLPKMVPADKLGDAAFPFYAKNLAGGFVGVAIMIGVVAAVQSTLDSALHLVGVFTAEDIIARFRRGLGDATMLLLARSVTAIFGVVCMGGAFIFAFGVGGAIIQLVNIWLGTLASAVLFPLVAALFWPRATRYGAIWGSAGGFVAYFGTGLPVLLFKAVLPLHPLYFGLGVSLVLTIVVSLLTRPASEAALARFFEAAPARAS